MLHLLTDVSVKIIPKGRGKKRGGGGGGEAYPVHEAPSNVVSGEFSWNDTSVNLFFWSSFIQISPVWAFGFILSLDRSLFVMYLGAVVMVLYHASMYWLAFSCFK